MVRKMKGYSIDLLRSEAYETGRNMGRTGCEDEVVVL
jgi:hypothetical protein